MVTDKLTKSLTSQKYNNFVKIINMVNVKHLIILNLKGHKNSSSKFKDLE
jgi:hypothetical protein